MITPSTSDRIFDLRGLSTDTKPTIYHGVEVGNGSQFLELDTTDVYLYDEENKQWRKFA